MGQILAWCGLDVSKKTFDVGLVVDQSLADFAKVPTARFARDEHGVKAYGHWLEDKLRGTYLDRRDIGFVMESTGTYSLELFELLRHQGWEHISIVNPRLVSDFNKSLGLRHKTDRIDSRALGFYGRERTPPPYVPREPQYQQLRDLVRYRRALVNEKTAITLRMASTHNKFVLKCLKGQINSLEKFLTRCEGEIKKLIKQYQSLSTDVALLCSMVGIGPITAWTVLGELGDLRAFSRSRQLSSLAGTAPTIRESGTSVRRKTRLTKDCGKAVREVLYMAALSAIRAPQGPFSQAYERLVGKGKPKKAALCAVMRKMLVVMRAMLLSSTPFNPELPGSCGKSVEKVGNSQLNLPILA